MARIQVNSTRVGGVKKRITDLNKYLENDITKEAFSKAEEKIQTKWKTDIPRIFNVRSSMGYACDGILAKSLAIVKRGKNSVIVYVEPIVRYSKNTLSSGGAVNNLTSILFHGSDGSFGKYYPRWDARVQTGRHPGTSPSIMRNYWAQFKKFATAEIRKGINEGMKKKMGSKK